VTGMSAGAAWQDTKVGFGHYSRWEKVAVCSDREWLRHSVDIFGYLIPGEVKAFTSAQEDEARHWVSNLSKVSQIAGCRCVIHRRALAIRKLLPAHVGQIPADADSARRGAPFERLCIVATTRQRDVQ
jgi:hypothetical protein